MTVPPDAMSQFSVEQFQRAYYQAIELAAFKGGFLARTAHELRSPLNKVISLQEMILGDLCDDSAEERECVAEAQAAAMVLLEYLDLMIQVSKLEMGRLTPHLQSVSLSSVFERVAAMTTLQARDRNLHLEIEAADPALQVQTDPDWLTNALINLLDLAIPGRDRGTLRLRVAPVTDPEVCHLWLEDDRPTNLWQEAAPLPPPQAFDLERPLSSSLRLTLVEALLSSMGGQLTLLVTPTPDQSLSRLAITLPWVRP
jgi:signal transduction histidine kinase